MPAFLSPNGKQRIVVDRVITLGGGKAVCELQGQFFSLNGEFLDDMAVAESLPPAYRARAVKFVAQYRAAKQKEEEAYVEPPAVVPEPPQHIISDELRAALDARTSEERAQEAQG